MTANSSQYNKCASFGFAVISIVPKSSFHKWLWLSLLLNRMVFLQLHYPVDSFVLALMVSTVSQICLIIWLETNLARGKKPAFSRSASSSDLLSKLLQPASQQQWQSWCMDKGQR